MSPRLPLPREGRVLSLRQLWRSTDLAVPFAAWAVLLVVAQFDAPLSAFLLHAVAAAGCLMLLAVVTSAYSRGNDGYLRYLAFAMPWVALFELAVAFAAARGTPAPEHLHRASFFLQAGLLAVAPLWADRKVRVPTVVIPWAVVAALLFATVLGAGTASRLEAESSRFADLGIGALLAVGLAGLVGRRSSFEPRLHALLVAATITTFVAFAAFALRYGRPVGEEVSHAARIFGIWLFYVAAARSLIAVPSRADLTYRELFTSSTVGVSLTRPDGTFVAANPAYAGIFGYASPEDLLAEVPNSAALYVDPDRALALAAVPSAGLLRDLEVRMRRRDGAVRWITGNVVALKNRDGGVLGYQASLFDITEAREAREEAKRQETALRESNERFELAAQATNDAVWDWNLVTDALSWSRAYQTLFGYSPEETEPSIASWYAHVHPDDVDRVRASIQGVIHGGGQAWSDEYRFERRDGSYGEILDRGFVVRDAGGKPLRMIGAMMDITGRKRAERMYAALGALNERVARAGNAEELLQAACEIAAASGNFQVALVRMVDAERCFAPTVARAGSDPAPAPNEGIDLRPGSADAGTLAATAYRTGRPAIRSGPALAGALPFGFEAARLGTRAAGAYPLMREGRCVGVLALRSRDPDAFEGEMGELLERMAANVAHGLETLEQAETLRRFRAALDHCADMIALVDRETLRYVDVNESLCRALGYSRQELLAMGPEQVLGETREELARRYDQIIDRGRNSGEVRGEFRCRDGSRIPFETTRWAMHSEGRSIIVGIARDIRERLAAEQALRKSEERFRSLVALSSDWYWEQDEQLRFVARNDITEEKAHLLPPAYFGSTRWELARASDDDPRWRAHKAQLERREPFDEFEYLRHSVDGVMRWVSVSGEPIFDAEGRFRGYRGVGRDITPRKRAEEERARIARMYASLSAMNKLVSRARSSEELLQGACEIAVASGDFDFSLVRMAEPGGTRAPIVAIAGSKLTPWLSRPLDLSENSVDAQSLVALAYRTGRPAIALYAELVDRPLFAQIMEDAGARSAGAYPLRRGGRSAGALLLRSADAHAFEGEMAELLERMVADVSHGLDALEAGEALRRFRLAIDHSADIMVLVDRQSMRFLDVNDTLCRLVGYTREELLAMRVEQLLATPRSELEQSYDALIANPDAPGSLRGEYRCKDGSLIPFESTRRMLRSGGRWLMIAVSRDIRERLAAEEALRRKDAYFRSLMENASDMFSVLDRHWRYVYASPAVARTLGCEAHEILGSRFLDKALPEDAASARAKLALLEQGVAVAQTMRVRRADPSGELRTFEVVVQPGVDESDAPTYIVTSRDITERVRREQEFRALVQNSPDVISRWSPERRCVFMNRAVAAGTGRPAEWFIGKRMGEMELPFASEWEDALGQAFATAEEVALEFSYPGLEGTRHFEARFVPELGEHGEPGSVMVISRNTTAHRQAEEARARMARLYAALSALNELVARAQSAEELLQGACEIAVASGEFGFALMRMADASARVLEIGAIAGREQLAAFRRPLELAPDSPDREALAVKAYRSGATAIGAGEALVARPGFENLTAATGARSAAAFPLRRHDRCIGAMVLNSADEHAFEGEFAKLLERMAANLSHGLDALAAREELRRHEAYFRSLIENVSDAIAVVDLEWRYQYVSPSSRALSGYDPEELVGKRFGDTTGTGGEEGMRARLAAALASGAGPQRARFESRHKDGERRVHEIVVSLASDTDGRPVYVIAGRDITDHIQAERLVAESEARLRSIVEATAEPLLLVDSDGITRFANPAAAALLGRSVGELEGAPLGLPLADGRPADVDIVLPGGAIRPAEMRFASTELQGRELLVVSLHDLSERKRYEAHIEHLANHDGLTGLPNRTLLRDRVEQAIVQARRTDRHVALVFVDLDQFKLVNDSFGHGMGDALLLEVGARLQRAVREGDTVARLGGDEFVILAAGLAQPGDSALVARKIAEALVKPVALDGKEMAVSASMGISLFPGDGDDLEALLKCADAAMYRAKDAGRSNYQFYSAEMGEQARSRVETEAGLRQALERGELRLHYQPQVDFTNGEVSGFEALLRWEHPQRGLVSPASFIPVAEESGLIVPIGQWALHEACRDAASLAAAGLGSFKIAVNLSARQFWQGSVTEVVRGALAESGLPPAQLEVEITESVVARDLQQVMNSLAQLRRMGVSVAIDDFGTGYSSLAYLRSLPIQKLKIDRSFIQGIPTDPEATALVGEIVRLAHVLSLEVVAEGVETQAQALFLRGTGCEAMQGFLFSRPLPLTECVALLRAGRRLLFNPIDRATD